MPGFLLDTNIISEAFRARAAPSLMSRYMAQKEENLFLSGIAIGELWQGVSQLASNHPKPATYRISVNFAEQRYHRRILPFNQDAARLWDKSSGRHRKKGYILLDPDTQITAIALKNRLTMVTANTRHFEGLGLTLLNSKEQKQ